ncbi:hypothetical protein HBH98_042340 [Parastagonospora nodorum]|nr:hypothetical protein HBH51_082160 [Parastagonospora nodorum]KAH4109244.1 hypothetical protein HBH46_035600 [Parastagonospora nodorum]KAH4130928.1 hypothetical protein HBH47_017730 [Parastagonospora nodorum]KAH4194980.1 hypothetical protein HBH42_087460 [Parastagonospora nodorum]KAH4231639.1 hypothetical protein HBI06_076770 [Parastagonospora nodorum]
MKGNRLVIGLDYGTTYTGISFCETSDMGALGKDIEVIKDWPMKNTGIGTKEKVPSEIGMLDRTQWGALIPPEAQRHMWTKLDLDCPQGGEAAKILQELSQAERKPSEDPVDIIADYLTHVKNHLVKNLDTQYGKELWRTLPITLVVTVPAVWSDAAKDSTLKAVRAAGFDTTGFPLLKRTLLTTEPEAAAIYTIQSLRGSVQDEQFAVGDGFILCDMGGGTVDLISYRVASLNPTTLEEATIGSGDQCGGSFVERKFIQVLERRLGTEDFVKIAGARSDALPRTCLTPKMSKLVLQFILEGKASFTGSEKKHIRLPWPFSGIEDDHDRGIHDGELVLTKEDLQEMFEFCLNRSYELIQEQLVQARRTGKVQIKYLFMVGGFAESPYMYEKIKSFAEAHGIQAIRPAFAWSAVVRGAAVKGLDGDGRVPIQNRKCRRNYGTDCNTTFEAGKHRESDSYVSTYTGVKRAINQMTWLLTKGQDLSTSQLSHANHTFHQNFWVGDSRMTSIGLLASEGDRAAKRSTDKSIYRLATLEVDLSGVPQDEFEVLRSPSGHTYHRIIYTVDISIQSSLDFSVSIGGKKYGRITARYA